MGYQIRVLQGVAADPEDAGGSEVATALLTHPVRVHREQEGVGRSNPIMSS